MIQMMGVFIPSDFSFDLLFVETEDPKEKDEPDLNQDDKPEDGELENAIS